MSFEDLISEVQTKPEIWQSSHLQFRNKTNRRRIWSEIAIKLGVEDNVLKKRWKHLKDQYRKELKKIPLEMSGAEAEEFTSWQYFGIMSFIRDELTPAESISNLNIQVKTQNDNDETEPNLEPQVLSTAEHSEIILQSPASRSSSTAATSRKRISNSLRQDVIELKKQKINLAKQRLANAEEREDLLKDEDYLFLMSIMPMMKKLNDIQKLQLRGRINEWLLQALSHPDEYPYLYNIQGSYLKSESPSHTH